MAIFLFCYGLLGEGMDKAATVLLDVDDGPSPLQAGGNLNCLKSHDVMHCLDGDVAGQSMLMIWVEQQGGVDDRGMGQLQCSSSGRMMLYEGEAAAVVGICIWLGNLFGIPWNSAINPIPNLLNFGIFIGVYFSNCKM